MGDCVPYAIHIATGQALSTVKEMAEQRGWEINSGMNEVAAWCMLRDMGVRVSPMIRPHQRTTVKQFLSTIDVSKTYIISVRDHWFAVRKGHRFDKARTHPRTVVSAFIEVQDQQPLPQAL